MNEAIAKSDSPGQPPLQRFVTLMRAYMALLATNFGACLVISGDHHLSNASRQFLRQGRRNLDNRARDLIKQGVADGTITPCNPAMATAAIFGAFNWVPHWRKTGNEAEYVAIADDFLKLFISGLRGHPIPVSPTPTIPT